MEGKISSTDKNCWGSFTEDSVAVRVARKGFSKSQGQRDETGRRPSQKRRAMEEKNVGVRKCPMMYW